ncbi:hypothetical protein AB0J71_17770 [Nonomuraea sp. NPDC049637]|uniref:hypothetical protein n=1 Tax=Nonomuraea sp. NPDC049637 TaxID=3154356 RepID=UPI003421DF22
MRPRHLSRRAVLAGGAAALTACSASGPAGPAAPAPDSPETVLLRQVVADKERTVALYSALIAGGADSLEPFRARHQAHLAELRKYLPAGPPPVSSPAVSSPAVSSPAVSSPASPGASPGATPSQSPRPTLSRLRDVERRAAAQRPRQLAGLSPGVAQLLASIGACEAVHAVSLPKSS